MQKEEDEMKVKIGNKEEMVEVVKVSFQILIPFPVFSSSFLFLCISNLPAIEWIPVIFLKTIDKLSST